MCNALTISCLSAFSRPPSTYCMFSQTMGMFHWTETNGATMKTHVPLNVTENDHAVLDTCSDLFIIGYRQTPTLFSIHAVSCYTGKDQRSFLSHDTDKDQRSS